MEKYSWSFKEHNEIWSNGAGSIKACLCQVRQAAAADENVVYVGENIPFIPTVSAESILEDLEAQASDFGGEIGEDWEAFDCKTMQKEVDELSEQLGAIVVEWLKKHGREPNFYQVENIKPHTLLRYTEEEE